MREADKGKDTHDNERSKGAENCAKACRNQAELQPIGDG
jgi:hypothetical protein